MAMALTTSPYERAVAKIEAVSWRGIKPGLERTEALLRRLGDPHRGLRGALVAGTNGKGSVCAIIDSVLRAASLRSVLLTKPHLTSYRERIAIEGKAIDERRFTALIEDVCAAAATLSEPMQPTGFELLTAAGILAARRVDAEVLVCEVGMGGRLDSTNVLDLGVAAITNVALDHREHLGDTVEAIAKEKAAIIKPGDVAVTTAEEPALTIIRERSAAVGADLRIAGGEGTATAAGVRVTTLFDGAPLIVSAPLRGRFQVRNVLAAVAACDALRAAGVDVTAEAVVRGCAAVRWRGRMQWIDGVPPVVVDAAHNPAGVAAALESLADLRGDRRVVAVFAAMRDKDVGAMAHVLDTARDMDVVVTSPSVQRAMSPGDLARHFTRDSTAVAGVAAALAEAKGRAGHDGLVFVCGSIYLAGEALTLLGA
jgi:dihydrofolate synthase/folylpolyglutamate synthase